MKTEKIIEQSSGRCLNIVAGKVESLRINENIENTARVYKDGCIGVEGRLGNADFDDMFQAAEKKIGQQIAYVETHEEGKSLHFDVSKEIVKEKDFIPTVSKLLDRLSAENPEFLFGNKVLAESTDVAYQNSDGADYRYVGNRLSVALTLKQKGSANIMDEFYGTESGYYNEEEICRDVKMQCDAFLTPLPHVEEDEVTIIGSFEPLQYALQHLISDLYFNNSSLFQGKLGEQIFDEKFSLLVDRTPGKNFLCPFFDREGVVNPDFKNHLIENGVLKRLLTTKKTAKQYNTENIGSASAPYDGVPTFGANGLSVAYTAENLKEIVKGKAIYLSNTSGGDMTPSGDVSMPAIVAYLYEDGKLLGKLPEFTVTGNVFDIFGKNFVGCVREKDLFSFGEREYLVYKAKLVNKK